MRGEPASRAERESQARKLAGGWEISLSIQAYAANDTTFRQTIASRLASFWCLQVKQSKHYVLVLWGQDFDEIAASIFVGELRRLGFLVKIVALNMQQTAGEHGVTLAPDLTLDRALTMVGQTDCVILPCALAAITKFSYDPRLAEFFRLCDAAKAIFVAMPKVACHLSRAGMPLSPDVMVIYPEVEELIAFVREVLRGLLKR